MASAFEPDSDLVQKVHSVSGILPGGFFTVQHLALNGFSLGGAENFDRVSDHYYRWPQGILIGAEVLLVWLPLLFHLVYRPTKAKVDAWSKLNRVSCFILLAFMVFRFSTTTLQVKLHGNNSELVNYAAMQAQLSSSGYLILAIYAIGVFAASFQLCFGLRTFCVRWGITVGEQTQARFQKASFGLFVAVTLLGWAALAGFLRSIPMNEPRQVLVTPSDSNTSLQGIS